MNYHIGFFVLLCTFFCINFNYAHAGSWTTVGGSRVGTDAYSKALIDFHPTNNEPYVAYMRESADNALVFRYNGVGWINIGTSLGTDYWPYTMDFSTTGIPYIALNHYSNGQKISYFSDSTWKTVPSSSDKGYEMVLDTNNNIYTLETVNVSGSYYLTVNKYNGTSWSFVGPQNIPLARTDLPHGAHLYIDTSNTLYAVYSYGDSLYALRFNGSAWISVGASIIAPEDALYPDNFDLTFDTANKPYIAFDENDDKIHVRSFDGSIWQTVNGDIVGNGNNPSIAFNPEDSKIYVSYERSGGNTVKKMDGSSWTTLGSDPFKPSADYYPQLAISPQTHRPFLALSDENSMDALVLEFKESTPIYRFWSNTKQGHFYTASEAEKDHVIDAYDDDVWKYEGSDFNAYASSINGATPIYRFWSNQKQHHFYTASEAEKDHVIDAYDDDVWKYEGIAYYAHISQISNSTPIYRFWSNTKQGHFYTASEAEKDHVIDAYDDDVWKYEGIGWYTPL